MFDATPASDPFENGRLFIVSLFRNQQTYGFADHLVGFVAKYSFRTFVPARDDAIEILRDDRIFRSFCHRAKLPKSKLCLLPVVDFDKQKINSGVECGDCSYQQEADENEGNERGKLCRIERKPKSGRHEHPPSDNAERMLARMPSQKPPSRVATTMAG